MEEAYEEHVRPVCAQEKIASVIEIVHQLSIVSSFSWLRNLINTRTGAERPLTMVSRR